MANDSTHIMGLLWRLRESVFEKLLEHKARAFITQKKKKKNNESSAQLS